MYGVERRHSKDVVELTLVSGIEYLIEVPGLVRGSPPLLKASLTLNEANVLCQSPAGLIRRDGPELLYMWGVNPI
jgi:hypothetical protein